jgi:excisionase family DNA binding protein
MTKPTIVTYEGKEYATSLTEVAKYLGIAYSTVYQYARIGLIQTIKTPRGYMVDWQQVKDRKERLEK